MTGKALPRHATPRQAKLLPALINQAMLRQAEPCQAGLGWARPCLL
jgi:hypothetical protein